MPLVIQQISFHVIFDHLTNLVSLVKQPAEVVNRTMMRNVRLSCDLRSSNQSRSLFFAISRIDEQNYDEKCSFVM